MMITTLWGVRRGYESDMPELMEAWDENSIYENPDGWDEACEKAIASWGNDLVRWRIVELDVVAGEIVAAFQNAVVRASTAKESQ